MRLTKREKILLGLLMFALLFYGAYQFVVIDQLDALALQQLEADRIQMELDRLDNVVEEEQQVDLLLAEVAEARETLLRDYFVLIDEQEEIILLMNEFLLNPDLRTSSLGFVQPAIVEEDEVELYFMDVNLTFEATFETLNSLLRSFWQFDRKVLVEQLNLSRGEEGLLTGNVGIRFYDLSNYTGELDRLFMWFQDSGAFKVNPFAEASANPPVAIRYVFLDSDAAMSAQQPYVPFEDVGGHWAEEAIHGLGEMGVFPPSGSLNFGPDQFISRGEFIIMLDRLYDWPAPTETVDLTQFEDYEELGRFEGAMAKAIYSGYLSGFIVGFDDNTLRPNAAITYTEVEFIFRNLLDDPGFAWPDAAGEIEAETGHASVGLTDVNAAMTRGEAAYFLYWMAGNN